MPGSLLKTVWRRTTSGPVDPKSSARVKDEADDTAEAAAEAPVEAAVAQPESETALKVSVERTKRVIEPTLPVGVILYAAWSLWTALVVAGPNVVVSCPFEPGPVTETV